MSLHIEPKQYKNTLSNLGLAVAILLCLVPVNSLQAQQLSSGADFLKLASGARGEGMGEAFTAVADDINALTWNPAGLALIENPQVGYLRMLYISDIAYNFGGAAVPIPLGEDRLGLGAGVINLGVPSFDSTNGAAPAVSAGDTAVFLSGAYQVKDMISFGVTGKYIMRNIAGFNAAAFGGDAGVLVTPGSGFRIGAGVFNVGQSVQFVSSSDPLPMEGRLGLAYQLLDLPQHSLLVAADAGYYIQSQSLQAGGGLEYWFQKTLALRVGYTGDTDYQHLTAGVGLNLKLFQFDYAYAPMDTLGDTHRISLILRFGTETSGGLSAPEGFQARSLEAGAELSWKASDSKDVVGYNLYLKKPGASVFARVTHHPIHDTALKLKSLKTGTSYTFGISSVSAAGRESSMTELTFTPTGVQAAVLAATPVATPGMTSPTGLTAAPKGAGLELTWDKAVSAEVTGFNLYLADASGKPPRKLTTKPLADNRVFLKKLDLTKNYLFFVTALNKAGVESTPSQTVTAGAQPQAVVPAILPPGHFMAVPGNKLARLTWDAANGAVGYHLYVSNNKKTYKRLTKHPLNSLKANLKSLKNGKAYYFAVTSVDADGKESAKTIRRVVPTRTAEQESDTTPEATPVFTVTPTLSEPTPTVGAPTSGQTEIPMDSTPTVPTPVPTVPAGNTAAAQAPADTPVPAATPAPAAQTTEAMPVPTTAPADNTAPAQTPTP
jgi:hypothetical protein